MLLSFKSFDLSSVLIFLVQSSNALLCQKTFSQKIFLPRDFSARTSEHNCNAVQFLCHWISFFRCLHTLIQKPSCQSTAKKVLMNNEMLIIDSFFTFDRFPHKSLIPAQSTMHLRKGLSFLFFRKIIALYYLLLVLLSEIFKLLSNWLFTIFTHKTRCFPNDRSQQTELPRYFQWKQHRTDSLCWWDYISAQHHKKFQWRNENIFLFARLIQAQARE